MKSLFACGAMMLVLGPAAAFAQAAPMSDIAGGKDVTCKTFLGLAPAAARDVLYFANGYAAGVEDQIAAGTPPAPAANGKPASKKTAGATAESSALSGLATIGMDQLRAVCEASPTATVLSVVPGGRPVTGSGTITGSGTGRDDAGAAAGGGAGAVTDTTRGGTAGTSAAAAAAQALSAPKAVTTPGSTTTNPATGIVTSHAGSTTLPIGAGAGSGASAGSAVAAPSAGAPVGGEAAAPGAGTTTGTTTGTSMQGAAGTAGASPGAAP